jgi:hypothetical protein
MMLRNWNLFLNHLFLHWDVVRVLDVAADCVKEQKMGFLGVPVAVVEMVAKNVHATNSSCLERLHLLELYRG